MEIDVYSKKKNFREQLGMSVLQRLQSAALEGLGGPAVERSDILSRPPSPPGRNALSTSDRA